MKRLILLALVLGLVGAGVGWWQQRPAARPNILLITVESLRPDHVGCFGSALPTTPHLDALAAEGVRYTAAHSVTSWTLASHASLFTGLYPAAHQAVGPLDRLNDSYQTLAEMLGGSGYQTAGVVSGPYLTREFNLHQGFEIYNQQPSARNDREAHGDVTNPQMTQGLQQFLTTQRDSERPFFLFAYYWDPHYDYIPPSPYDKQFVTPQCSPCGMKDYGISSTLNARSSAAQIAFAKAQYAGEIRWTDEHLGQLFDTLKAQKLWDSTTIIVTADHGEEFFEHGTKGHKNNLHVESVHVPLIIKWARGTGPEASEEDHRGAVDSRLVSLIDIVPTLLENSQIETDVPLQGVSLTTATPPQDRAIHFELLSVWFHTDAQGKHSTTKAEWLGVQQGQHKLLTLDPGKKRLLYNTANDPGEQQDLSDTSPQVLERLSTRLLQWREEMALTRQFFDTATGQELSPELLERLRSLGYLRK